VERVFGEVSRILEGIRNDEGQRAVIAAVG